MTAAANDMELPAPWTGLRKEVTAENHVLSKAIFERIRIVFAENYAGKKTTPGDLTREFWREEFLLVVDERGEASEISDSDLQNYRNTVANAPDFARWFNEACLPEGGHTLLAARWLCHLIGLRHRTVEIFLDPPHLDGHTLVQVRGLEKFEAPGAFDIPCAGHVSGIDTVEESLCKELVEELNLSFADLRAIKLIKQYNSYTDGRVGESVNHEYRFLYRAFLKSTAVKRIRFTDGEVAGLAIFSVADLQALIDRFPERIASGLSNAMTYYI
jgi:isopentenyldiphosphate isomerase